MALVAGGAAATARSEITAGNLHWHRRSSAGGRQRRSDRKVDTGHMVTAPTTQFDAKTAFYAKSTVRTFYGML
jgi:hypothetical protein